MGVTNSAFLRRVHYTEAREYPETFVNGISAKRTTYEGYATVSVAHPLSLVQVQFYTFNFYE